MTTRYLVTIEALDDEGQPNPEIRTGTYEVAAGEVMEIAAAEIACAIHIRRQAPPPPLTS